MRLIRWTVLGIGLALLGGCNQDKTSYRQSLTMVPHWELDGTWEILSVHRDGEPDPVQIGATLTFTNGEVKFQPNVPQFDFSG